MSGKSSIEWTECTWNPVRGCTRNSEGCRNCYAEAIAARFSGPGLPYDGLAEMRDGKPRWTGKLEFSEAALLEPLRRRKPTVYFVNSMSDLFHEKMPDAWIDRVFAAMALCPQHTFQVLTKRANRMRAYLSDRKCEDRIGDAVMSVAPVGRDIRSATLSWTPRVGHDFNGRWPLPNVWLGTSCEDQPTADARVPDLRDTPAAIRFVSAEPLLGPIDFRRWLMIDWQCSCCREFFTGRYLSSCPSCRHEGGWTGSHAFNGRRQPKRPGFPIDRGSGLDWIIVGGESGTNARIYREEWGAAIQRDCAAAGVAFFRKQLGSRPLVADLTGWRAPSELLPDGSGYLLHLADKKGVDWNEWPEWLRVRQLPAMAARLAA